MVTLHKVIHAKELIDNLEDLDRMLEARFPEDNEGRIKALSYILYRGMEAMREEWAREYAQRLAAHGQDLERMDYRELFDTDPFR
jgi:hypothetical protein